MAPGLCTVRNPASHPPPIIGLSRQGVENCLPVSHVMDAVKGPLGIKLETEKGGGMNEGIRQEDPVRQEM